MDRQIGRRVRALRVDRSWSLDELAKRSGVSRATLSRLENAEVSATAAVLARICRAFDLPMSRLIHMAEGEFRPFLARADQPVWSDPVRPFRRRSVSPPGGNLQGEAVEVELGPATRIDYEAAPRPGLEHHLYLLAGRLRVWVEGRQHDLLPGDCLRYRLNGRSAFATAPGEGARYLLFMV